MIETPRRPGPVYRAIATVVFLAPPGVWIAGGRFGWWSAPTSRAAWTGAYFAWWAVLGLLGLAVAGLLQWLVWSKRSDQPHPDQPRSDSPPPIPRRARRHRR